MHLAKLIQADEFSRLVAVKLLHTQWSEDGEIASRMRDEARLLGRLRHKHIVDVYDLTRIDGRTALVMEFLEAVDLKAVVKDTSRHKVRIPLRVSLEIAACVASALDAAYNRPPYSGERPLRVIHRDIKPSNIMLDCHGMVKVLDFGVAWADFDQRESKTEELSFGSIDYMSPERLFFDPETPNSDVYSLGCTLFELIAQQKFGKAKLTKSEHDAWLVKRLDELVQRHPMPSPEVGEALLEMLGSMLAYRESDRPSSADCVARLRRMAKTISGHPTLEEWSEKRVTALVKQQEQVRTEVGSKDSLTGRTLLEDGGWLVGGRSGPTHSAPPRPVAPASFTQKVRVRTAPLDACRAGTLSAHGEEGDDEDVPTVVLSQPGLPAAGLGVRLPRAEAHQPSGTRKLQGLVCLCAGLLCCLGGGATTAIAGGTVFYFHINAGQPMGLHAQEDPPAKTDPVRVRSLGAEKDPGSVGGHMKNQTRFVSRLFDTRKMRVTCTAGKGQGQQEVTLSGANLGDCRISAQRKNRSVAVATVKDAEPRVYRCFSHGEMRCE